MMQISYRLVASAATFETVPSSGANIHNCSSMACKWLKDACFTPPCNPRTIVFPMPFGIGRGGYINE